MSYSTRQSSRYSQRPVRLFLFYGSDNFGPYGFTDSETSITRSCLFGDAYVDVTFVPWPVSCEEISQSGTLDKTDTTISLALGSALDNEYVAYPPSQIVNVTIFEGTDGDEPTAINFPVIWVGRVTGAYPSGSELKVDAIPAMATMRRVALRRNYQLTCPHSLYGPKCKASEAAATVSAVVIAVSKTQVTLRDPVESPRTFKGGMLKWTNSEGRREVRTIVSFGPEGFVATIRGVMGDLASDTTVSLVKGCNRVWDQDCTLVHNNVLNFGGQPFIPLENPISSKNHFF